MKNIHKITIAIVAVVAVGAGLFFFLPRATAPNGQQASELTPRVDRGIEPEDEEMVRGKIAQLEADYQAEIEKGENGITVLLQIGNWYYTLGELDTAISYYDRILKDFPSDAPALENKGQAQIEMGDYAGAEASWRMALVTHPYDLTYLRLADLIITHFPERVGEVGPLLEEGIASVGQTIGLLIALGDWHRLGGRLVEAVSHYEVALTLDPENTALREQIATVRAELAREQLQGK